MAKQPVTSLTPAPTTRVVAPQEFTDAPVAGVRTAFDIDPIEQLPEGGPAGRLRQLRDKARDDHHLIPPFDETQEASLARVEAESRLTRLQAHASAGGFGLGDEDPRVVAQKNLVKKATDDFRRLNERTEIRSKAWRESGAVVQNVENWLKYGRPAHTILETVETDVPKPAKNENGLLDVIENRRRRARELRADLERTRAAPYPAAYAKAQAKAQVQALAERGRVDVTMILEHDEKILWPTLSLRSTVYNAPGTVAFAETVDVAGILCWAFGDALLLKINAEIDAESDPAAALSREERQEREAEIMGDLLDVERSEAAATWAAIAQGLPVQPRIDISPQALLGVRLVSAPRTGNGQMTSPEHGMVNVIFSGSR